jgi:Tfp pilus assembly protein FimT
VVAIIGIMAILSMSTLMGFWRAATLAAGAQDLRVVLNGARHLAIRQNTDVCVEHTGHQLRLRLDGCAGPVWRGPRSDASGWLTLVNDVEVTAANARVTFSFLGAASPAGTFVVRNRRAPEQTLTVTVAASGRISIP